MSTRFGIQLLQKASRELDVHPEIQEQLENIISALTSTLAPLTESHEHTVNNRTLRELLSMVDPVTLTLTSFRQKQV